MMDKSSSVGNLLGDNGAWVKYIMKASLPNVENAPAEKKKIVEMLTPLMESSNRGNLTRHQCVDFLIGYDVLWMKYFAYRSKGRKDSDIILLRNSLREAYALELSRSIDFGMMKLLLHQTQNVFQRVADVTKQKTGWFKTKEKEREN